MRKRPPLLSVFPESSDKRLNKSAERQPDSSSLRTFLHDPETENGFVEWQGRRKVSYGKIHAVALVAPRFSRVAFIMMICFPRSSNLAAAETATTLRADDRRDGESFRVSLGVAGSYASHRAGNGFLLPAVSTTSRMA